MAQRFICTLLICTLALTLFAGCRHSPQNAAPTHTISEETATWSMHVADAWVTPPNPNVCVPPPTYHAQFLAGFAVEARILEILPDVYVLPEKTLQRDEHHVLRLEVMDVIAGEGVPKEIYYLLDASMEPDLRSFDSLIISLRQLSYDSYLLFNTTQCRYEQFSPLFKSDNWQLFEVAIGQIYPDPTRVKSSNRHSIFPFTDGVLDTSIDALPGWDGYVRDLNSNQNHLPVRQGDSLQQVKDAIVACQEEYKDRNSLVRTVQTPDIYPDADTYRALCSFDRGIFAQIMNSRGKAIFSRIVNGFYTNEYYTFTPGENMVSSTVQFTQEEIDQLPDLKPLVDTVMEQIHEADPLWLRLLDAYYYKTEQHIYGVVRAYWEDRSDVITQVNYIALPNGQVKQVSTKALESYLQDDWETANQYEAWNAAAEKAYFATPIYEKKDGEFGFRHQKDFFMNAGYSLVSRDRDMPFNAQAIPLSQNASGILSLLDPQAEYWSDPYMDFKILSQKLKYTWELTTSAGGAEARYLKYLLILDDGTLLLATGYDYTGIYVDDPAPKKIHYLSRLTENGDGKSFFEAWESYIKPYKDKRPEDYNLWLSLSRKYR